MLVREFNEFIQFGFPKGCFEDGERAWYDFSESKSCEYTAKLNLPDDEKLPAEILEACWIVPELYNTEREVISLEEAVAEWQALKKSPKFSVGDKVCLVSERGFVPTYWRGHERYTAYLGDLTITSINDYKINYSFVASDEKVVESRVRFFNPAGYRIVPVHVPHSRNRRAVGFTLDYEEYLVYQDEEIEAKLAEAKKIQATFKSLFLCAGELFYGASYNPEKYHEVSQALEIISSLLNDVSKNRIQISQRQE